MDAPYVGWFLLLAPLAAAVAILLHLHRKANMAIFASVGSASVCFLIALAVAWGTVPMPDSWTWMALQGPPGSAGVHIEVGLLFDRLSKAMLLVVTGVGLLVHIFSIGYMANDPAKGRFFGGLSLFMFSMTGIVLATNLIEMFFFWEGVGLSSYLLIGFWYTRESAAAAANKAFVCNRLADFGFLVGIFTYWTLFGSVSVLPGDLLAVSGAMASTLSPILLTIMVLGLFAGCVGKSAMFPLHVWLPDAMEGPTPVSALIHAATMVAAGVYMLCRVYPLLLLSPTGLEIIAFIGCFTAIFAALIAVQQNDIKRILAYSTLSQLGYMVMAVGCGGPDAAMFHLTTHAFFKALLFLAAGSIIHALHEEQDIWKMGGLAARIPLTAATFAVGTLALIGCPLFSGSFSKDYILGITYLAHPFFYWVGVTTAVLTAFYMTRLAVVVFLGAPRTEAAGHPHESPLVMTIPLILLAVLALVGGWSVGTWGLEDYFHTWMVNLLRTTAQLPSGPPLPAPEIDAFIGWIVPCAAVCFGVFAGYFIYHRQTAEPLSIPFLRNKFYLDEFYERSLVGGQQVVARMLNWLDRWILEGFLLRGSAYVSVGLGEILRLFQTGSLQTYAFLFSLGGALLIYFILFP